jgi:hypothetical protein
MAFGDFTVVRASTKIRLGSNGLYGSVANNVPAFEFNGDGTYRGLLVEPGATNLLLHNNDFSNAYWTKTNTTPTSEVDAKLGTRWLITDSLDGAPALHIVGRVLGLTAGSTTAGSKIYAKAGTLSRIRITQVPTPTATLTQGADINLSTGAVLATNGTTSVVVTNVGDGWYEIECGTNGVSTNSRYHLLLLDNSGNASYQGNGTGTLYIARAMKVDNTSICGSDIVTTAGTASRVADVITLTSASSLIGQTANTLYVEGEIQTFTGASDACIFALTDGTNAEAIVIRTVAANGRIEAVVRDGGSDQATLASCSFPTGVFKCAIASAVNDVAFYLNGSSVGTDTSATHPALSVFQFGGTVAVVAPTARPVWFRAIADFPTRIANATLVTLTTP